MRKGKEVIAVVQEAGEIDLAIVMEGEAKKRALITKYISVHMKSGTDYGTIKFGNKESKPSLFKPGSEKFLSLFKFTAKFDKDSDTWEMAGSEAGVFAYKCTLLTSKGEIVGEGRGVSKLSEKAGWTINNAVKIAEKRAQIDAVLRTGALSDFFTQDLEDMAQSYDTSPVASDVVPTVHYDNSEDVPPTKSPTNTQSNSDKPWRKAPIPKEQDPTLILKKRIMDLADSIVAVPLDKDEYVDYIEGQTGLQLKPENFPIIIERLEALK